MISFYISSHVTIFSSTVIELRRPLLCLTYCKSNIKLACHLKVLEGMALEKTVIEGLIVKGILIDRSMNEKSVVKG